MQIYQFNSQQLSVPGNAHKISGHFCTFRSANNWKKLLVSFIGSIEEIQYRFGTEIFLSNKFCECCCKHFNKRSMHTSKCLTTRTFEVDNIMEMVENSKTLDVKECQKCSLHRALQKRNQEHQWFPLGLYDKRPLFSRRHVFQTPSLPHNCPWTKNCQSYEIPAKWFSLRQKWKHLEIIARSYTNHHIESDQRLVTTCAG